ncbi:MAG: hypothetical protein AAFP70_17225, partial [Calditrichota bacterium]
MKIALRMLWNEIGVWGIFIILSLTMLAGTNPYHVLYTSLFLLFGYLLIIYQMRKANVAILQQMYFLPDYSMLFLRASLIFTAPIALFLGLLFFVLSDVIRFEDFVVLLHLISIGILLIYAMLYPVKQNYSSALLFGVLLFISSSVISVFAILGSMSIMALAGKYSTGGVLTFGKSSPETHSVSKTAEIYPHHYIRQFLRLKFQRIEDVRANALFGIAFLWVPFVYSLHSMLQNNNAAVFSFFVFGICAVLVGLYSAALLISQDLLNQLSYTGQLRDYYRQLSLPVFAILLLFSGILCIIADLTVENVNWLDIAASLFSGLLFLDALVLHLSQSAIRKRYMPLWLLFSIVLLLSAPGQQLFLVLPVFIAVRLWDSYPR